MLQATNDSLNPSHFGSSHRRLGLVLLILLPIQLGFGYFIHAHPTTVSSSKLSVKSKPWTNILHPLGGVVILVLGWITVWQGFEEWEIWSGLGPVPQGVRVVYGIIIGVSLDFAWPI